MRLGTHVADHSLPDQRECLRSLCRVIGLLEMLGRILEVKLQGEHDLLCEERSKDVAWIPKSIRAYSCRLQEELSPRPKALSEATENLNSDPPPVVEEVDWS